MATVAPGRENIIFQSTHCKQRGAKRCNLRKGRSEILSGVENARLAHGSIAKVFPELPAHLHVGILQGDLAIQTEIDKYFAPAK
jgi:hypothetical protein